MTLSSMVLSSDWPEISVLECILSALHMEVAVETKPVRAMAKLCKSKIDALIVDCDLEGSTTFLKQLNGGVAQQTVPLVIFSGSSLKVKPKASLASFFFQKPISVEQAVRTLSAARTMIVDGRLRYHRHPLNAPISLKYGRKKNIDGQLMNISQGGLRINLSEPLPADDPLEVSFALPGTKHRLTLEAEVAWQNQHGHAGIRFVSPEEQAKRDLQLWLEQRFLSN